MKKVLFAITVICAMSFAFGAEGDTGTIAYKWGPYKALDSITLPKGDSLTHYRGKVVLLVVFQWNCGGCNANAPTIGKLADSLGSGVAGKFFQAVGTEISNATNNFTFGNLQAQYNTNLRRNAPNVNFPLVRVPADTAITTDGVGAKWHRYNSYRDNYFIIDTAGKITGHVIGNRANAMAADSLTKLRTILFKTLAGVTTSISCIRNCNGSLKSYRQGDAFHFNLGSSTTGPVSLQILDLQGRMIRSFSVQSGADVIWNGSGSIPFGNYFVKISGAGLSSSQRLSWTP